MHEYLGGMAEAFAVPWKVQSVGARGAECRGLRVENIGSMEQSTGEEVDLGLKLENRA